MKTVLYGFVASLALAALVPTLTYTYIDVYAETDPTTEMQLAKHIPRDEFEFPKMDRFITIDSVAQEKIALETIVPARVQQKPETEGFGRIEADPSRVFTVRVPITGVLRIADGFVWPSLGEVLADGSTIGIVTARLGAADRVNLSTRLAQARATAEEIEATLSASRAALTRARVLNADDKNVSDRVLQEAVAKVKTEEARKNAAHEQARLIEEALATDPNSPAVVPLPLIAVQGGEVVELLANPGEAVQSGDPIMRVARYDRVFARINLMPGDAVDESIAHSTIVVLGEEDRPLEGERVAIVQSTMQTGARSFLFSIEAGDRNLRPGQAVSAVLPLQGEGEEGIIIPRSAVVRHGGQTWVYIQSADQQFSRHAISLDRSTREGWITTTSFIESDQDRIVVTGAQVILSEEIKGSH